MYQFVYIHTYMKISICVYIYISIYIYIYTHWELQEGRFVENQQILMHLNEDLHNFLDATGFWTSDWVLKVYISY